MMLINRLAVLGLAVYALALAGAGQVLGQKADERVGARGYVLTTSFAGQIPVMVNFTSGVVSGQYELSKNVTDTRNPNRREVVETSGTVEGQYRNGTVDFTLREAGARKVMDPCGSYVIRSFAEFTFSGAIDQGVNLTPAGDVATRYRLDPAMIGTAQKVEGQNVPPVYIVQCGRMSSGFSFSDKDLGWKNSVIKGRAAIWSAKACAAYEQLSGTACVCKPGQEEVCAANKIAPQKPGVLISVARTGEGVTYRKNGQKPELPLTNGTKLEPGDVVTALLDSAILKIGEHVLTVYAPSSFSLDEAELSPENIQRTRASLFGGVIKTSIPHRPAPAGDFHVATPGANASIRGSEMVVRYSEAAGQTTVYVTQDEAFVKGEADQTTTTVTAGDKISIGPEQKVGVVAVYVASELPADEPILEVMSWLWYGLGGLVVILGGLALFFGRRKK